MRAQANFIEHAPFVLILIGALELSGANRIALAALAAIFVIARILHGLGMDCRERQGLRAYGMISSSLMTLTLVLWALFCAAGFLLGR